MEEERKRPNPLLRVKNGREINAKEGAFYKKGENSLEKESLSF
jgi:hypothetical protein